jgi:hypothetical protein
MAKSNILQAASFLEMLRPLWYLSTSSRLSVTLLCRSLNFKHCFIAAFVYIFADIFDSLYRVAELHINIQCMQWTELNWIEYILLYLSIYMQWTSWRIEGSEGPPNCCLLPLLYRCTVWLLQWIRHPQGFSVCTKDSRHHLFVFLPGDLEGSALNIFHAPCTWTVGLQLHTAHAPCCFWLHMKLGGIARFREFCRD